MKESDYYPMGSYNDPSAPWNEVELPEEEFDVTISQTLSRDVVVSTNDYIEYGEDTVPDISETDWDKVYKDNSLHTPLELIGLLKEYVTKDIEQTEALEENFSRNMRLRKLQSLLKECDDWNDDETEYCPVI